MNVSAIPLSQPAPLLPRMSKVTGEPITDNYSDPLDVTDIFLDRIDSESDATVLAYFDHWGGCSEDPSPSLASIAMRDGETIHRSAEWVREFLGNDFIEALEDRAWEEL